MKILILFGLCLLLTKCVFAQSQKVIYSVSNSPNMRVFRILVYPYSDPVNAIGVSDTSTGLLSGGTSPPACRYGIPDSFFVLIGSDNDTDGSKYYYFEVAIIYYDPTAPVFSTTDGTTLGCYFTVLDIANGIFQFHIRVVDQLYNQTSTDREYLIQSFSTSTSDIEVNGSTTFTEPPSITAISPTAYTVNMSVVDDTLTEKTSLELGESAQLKFEMTIIPYEANMDLAGARLTSCIVSQMASFTSPAVLFIGSDGCFEDVDIFGNMHTNTGFSKHASSSIVHVNGTGDVKTFIAYSPKFEMSAFANNPVDVANNLYFRCDVTFCLDDTDDSTAGQCGADHCDPSQLRKKRANDPKQKMDSVFASVNITGNKKPLKSCIKCSTSTIFKAVMAVLSTACAILLGVMIMSFILAKRAIIDSLQRGRNDVLSSGVDPK